MKGKIVFHPLQPVSFLSLAQNLFLSPKLGESGGALLCCVERIGLYTVITGRSPPASELPPVDHILVLPFPVLIHSLLLCLPSFQLCYNLHAVNSVVLQGRGTHLKIYRVAHHEHIQVWGYFSHPQLSPDIYLPLPFPNSR